MNTQLFNAKESSSKRKIISFAYLAQASKDDADLIGGISSIFKPIAKQFAGDIFEPEHFCSVVNDLYGLKIHPWAAMDLTKRLAANGVLIEEKLVDNIIRYRYANIDEEYSDVRESDITLVVNKFIEYSEPKLEQYNISLNKQELGDSFLNHLVDLNFIQTTLRAEVLVKSELNEKELMDEDKENWRHTVREASRINSLCAGFVLHAFHVDQDLYELILKIVSGALIAEVVLNFQEPALDASMARVNIILDTPFLMALFNLTCEKEHEFANQLCAQIVERNATLAVYEHSIEELIGNLKAVIVSFETNRSHGATGRRLRDKTFNTYLRQVLKDPSIVLKQRNIRVLKDLTSEGSLKFFSTELEESLCNTFGYYYNRIAQERDARSIALTMRYRNGAKTKLKEFYNCNHIFLTENSFIPDKSMDFMLRHRLLSEAHVPPAVSGRYISGLLWVLFGAKGKDLSRQLLLANCAAALEPKSDVIAKMHQFLTRTDASQAELFDALMGQERAGQYLMQYSLGDASLLTRDNVETILNHLKESLTEKIQAQATTQIEAERLSALQKQQALERDFDELISQKDAENIQIKSKLLDSETLTFESSERIRKLELAAAENALKMQEQQRKDEENYQNSINKVMKESESKMKNWQISVDLIILFISVLAAILSSSFVQSKGLNLTALILGFVLSLLSLEVVKLYLLKKFFIKIRDNNFDKLLDQRDIVFDQERYKLDWTNLLVKRLTSTNETTEAEAASANSKDGSITGSQ